MVKFKNNENNQNIKFSFQIDWINKIMYLMQHGVTQ